MRIAIFTFLIFLVSCSKNEFQMDFNISEEVTDNYNVIYYATDLQGGKTIQSVASVMKGKCYLKGVTKLPTLVYITAKNSKLPLVVYAEKEEKIKLMGDTGNPLGWKVEGNPIDMTLTDWRLENIETLSNGNVGDINKIVADYVNVNPENPVALILLLSYYDRGMNETEYISLLGKVSKVADKNKWMIMAARADQYTNELTYPARIESLVARSREEWPDTLFFSGKAPGFILFWQNDMKGRNELVDSMKLLVKEFPDSTLRIIADINLDNDSTVWRNSIKRDSLKTTHRLWSPAGYADKNITKLKVGDLPYYIILDSLGVQQYRGIKIEDAMQEFRNQMRKKKDAH